MILTESNKDIENLRKHLDKIVLEFRRKYPKSNLLFVIKKFYDEVILAWMEDHYLVDKELEHEYDEIIKNKILDLINRINKKLK